MNIVNMSIEMKKPYTPVDNKVNHIKNSFVSGCSFHEAKVPVNTIMLESSSITTLMPSTPTAYAMLSGANQTCEYVYSISAVLPAAR